MQQARSKAEWQKADPALACRYEFMTNPTDQHRERVLTALTNHLDELPWFRQFPRDLQATVKRIVVMGVDHSTHEQDVILALCTLITSYELLLERQAAHIAMEATAHNLTDLLWTPRH
jgi:hypothetical protein